MTRRFTISQAYEELTKITMKHGASEMNRILYEKFKKRRVDLLDLDQVIELFEYLEDFYNKGTK